MNFYNRPECITLSDYIDDYGTKSGIFVFKNFIPESLLEKLEASVNSKEEAPKEIEQNLIDWYADKTVTEIDGTFELWELISELLYPTWVIHPQISALRITPEHEGMYVHADSPGKDQCHRLFQTDTWRTCCLLDYGAVAYFGDFEGGAIHYPNLNSDGTPHKDNESGDGKGFEYSPNRGDLVIHSAFYPYEHGVRPISSGMRYAFSTFSLKAADNPGTFYNYKSEEYIKQVGKKTPGEIANWVRPLYENPQFTAEKIKEYKSSGLKGDELAEHFFADMVEN
jgi:hypothetical protein